MSKCLYCGRELPPLQTLCQECYERRYIETHSPRSLFETLRDFVSNPLNITDSDWEDVNRFPAPLAIAFCFGGLLLCWFGGWARVRYRYSLFSGVVVVGALICFVVSLLAALVLARKKLRWEWDTASVIFLLTACGVAGYFYVGSSAISTLLKAAHAR